MPAAVAVPAAISAGSSIFGGIMGSRAAHSAADAQAAAAAQAQKYIEDLLGKYNPAIGTAASDAAAGVTSAASGARDYLSNVLAGNRSDVLAGLDKSTALLAPYLDLGTGAATTLSDLMKPGGDLNRTFNFEDIKTLDPGYQFRMDQASKALQASAAAKGGALGGGALQALANLNQNLASSEAGAAFDRLTSQQNSRFARLNSLLGTGFSAAGRAGDLITGANQFLANEGMQGGVTLGNWLIDPAEYAGTMNYNAANAMATNALNTGRSVADLMTGGAAAKAAGTVGAANAWGGMLSGLGNTANQIGRYYQDKNLLSMMKNPALGVPA